MQLSQIIENTRSELMLIAYEKITKRNTTKRIQNDTLVIFKKMLNPKYIGKYMNLELLIFLKNYIGKLSPKSGKEINSKFSKLRFWLF